MKYVNPILKGFYPDPSVCFANGKFYMVCSSFQYFPGVPIFESNNLINWTQIGHVLTSKSQLMLEKVNSSEGIFAPTIRYNNGRFYMVTTNNTTHKNFYVYTDNIYNKWSEPITVEQDGIDPSLLFDNGKTYFISNGSDDKGERGIVQCEIDIATGEKLSTSKCIWKGSGGRFLEGPHMYKIGNWYYLMAAEGGTEYGHMITYARASSVWGDFQNYPYNPVLTNRNKAPYIIQGIGHGELVQNTDKNWYIISLGFRQMHLWMQYHHLGREVFLTPVTFENNDWFSAGNDGTTDNSYEIAGNLKQIEKKQYTFENTEWNKDWCFLRNPEEKNYKLSNNKAVLYGSKITLDDIDSPTFLGIRQKDFCFTLFTDVTLCNYNNKNSTIEGGVTFYMCENEHYDISLLKNNGSTEAILKLNIGGIKHIQNIVTLQSTKAKILVKADNMTYHFYICEENSREIYLGNGLSKYLSSEVSGGFTGVVIGLYAIGEGSAEFTNFEISY